MRCNASTALSRRRRAECPFLKNRLATRGKISADPAQGKRALSQTWEAEGGNPRKQAEKGRGGSGAPPASGSARGWTHRRLYEILWVEFDRHSVRVYERRMKMRQGRIIVITGSPGTGKTTTASIIAKETDMDKSVHMHTDDFYHFLSKGAIPPHLPGVKRTESGRHRSLLEAAKRYARGGYDVIVDGIIGPVVFRCVAQPCPRTL